MHRHLKPSRFSKRTKTVSASVAGLVVAGTLASAPFIANASAQHAATTTATAALNQQGGRDAGQLSVYTEQAKAQAQQQAQAALGDANAVVSAAANKVDASTLASTAKQLANYQLLSVGRVEALTDATRTATQQTQDAIAAADAAAAAAAQAAAEAAAQAAEAARVANTPDGARAQARDIMASTYGWGDEQYQCLNKLWTKESGWRVEAVNRSSGATGIPQSLPGSKMATIADDWQTSARTQILWGLGYIKGSYGTPCSAWSHSQSMDWY